MNTLKERILTIIEKNSRINLKELAIMLGTEEIEVANALQEMETDGIICGYHTMINWDKTGIEKVTALIEVRVTPQRGQGFEDIAERIYKYPEVSNVYLMSGGYDLLVLVEARTLKELALFVSEKLSPLEMVTGTATSFVLKRYKEEGVIFDGSQSDNRLVVSP